MNLICSQTKEVLDNFNFSEYFDPQDIRWTDNFHKVTISSKTGIMSDPIQWLKLGLEICNKIPNLKVKEHGSIYVELERKFT